MANTNDPSKVERPFIEAAFIAMSSSATSLHLSVHVTSRLIRLNCNKISNLIMSTCTPG